MTAQERLQTAMDFAIKNRPTVGGFPYLAECMRQAGVNHNLWSVLAMQSTYMMHEGWFINQGMPLITGMVAVQKFNETELISAIRTDQEGNSTFSEFLKAAWDAGVVMYDVDFAQRTVTYWGSNNEQYVEEYSVVEVTELKF